MRVVSDQLRRSDQRALTRAKKQEGASPLGCASPPGYFGKEKGNRELDDQTNR